MKSVVPYDKASSKKEQIEEMFNNISSKYDFLNHILSLNIDRIWRKRAIKILSKRNVLSLLDVATGTGDFAIAASKIKNLEITGIDISEGMLEIAIEKVKKLNLSKRIRFLKGDSEKLEFNTESFDAVIVAFGVRNFENLIVGLKEMHRVTRKNGICIILEFSKPNNWIVRMVYNIYFNSILPFIGKLVSKDKRAYTYLPESVNHFPDGSVFLDILKEAGFKQCSFQKQTFGIATIYQGIK